MSAPAPLVTTNQAIGQECTLTVGSTSVGALLRGCSPNFAYASQPKLSSGPQSAAGTGSVAADQTLLGYSPSTGARSGFAIDFQVPYPGGPFLISLLDISGVMIKLAFGRATGGVGGVSVDTCICESLEVTGTEGGDIEGRATFQSVAPPVQGYTDSPATHDFWRFNDVTSIMLPGGTAHTDVNAFTWRLTRQLAAYRGNSPDGIPKYLRVARTECFLDATYLKEDDVDAATVIVTLPLLTHDAVVTLTQVPFVQIGGTAITPASLVLTCKDAFGDAYPQTQGDFETYVQEAFSAKSASGTYTIV
jgi:hypothetical protein